MSQCKVEFFDTSLELKHHDYIDSSGVKIDDDYLSPDKSSVVIRKTNKVPQYGFIRISGYIDFFGVISGTSDDDILSTVSFRPFVALFDFDTLIDVNDQGKVALEDTIKNAITAQFINNTDSYQNISILSVKTTSSTSWYLDLKSEKEDKHMVVANLYNTIIVKGMQKYGVGMSFSVNYATKKISVSIGVKNTDVFVIDSKLPNVEVKTFDINKTSNTVNKLRIYNTEDYSTYIDYFLHNDHTFDTNNSNRIMPVVCNIGTTAPSYEAKDGNKTVTKTFAQAAKEMATNTFSGIEWTDLIELQVAVNDPLTKPMSMQFGQMVDIIYEGKTYRSIFTGRDISNVVILQFGTVRKEYTKRIRLR